ncbi:uncharacterized protein LOC135085427 [Ostrinia nubilalis]|uniref:uncharacterized protein LOC135085427 n=1 Tax=Ostrinia nubilalis TaxID=29057 RepID=UPI0030824BF0
MRKLAIDCEMVASGNQHILAKVALVDENLRVILDTFVSPTATVTDYRYDLTGINPSDLRNAPSFSNVQAKVRNEISGCLLIGHSVADVDLKMLGLTHPSHNIRDVAQYPPFKKYNPYGEKPSLKVLAEKVLGERIQNGAHDPVEDARTCMKLYNKYNW